MTDEQPTAEQIAHAHRHAFIATAATREEIYAHLEGCPSCLACCCECGRPYNGSRSDALRSGWETYSARNQHAIDAGPLVCGDCVLNLLTQLEQALRDHKGDFSWTPETGQIIRTEGNDDE